MYDFCVLETKGCTKTNTSSGYKQITFPELRGESGDIVLVCVFLGALLALVMRKSVSFCIKQGSEATKCSIKVTFICCSEGCSSNAVHAAAPNYGRMSDTGASCHDVFCCKTLKVYLLAVEEEVK